MIEFPPEIYCFDTSAFVDSWQRYYSPESFPDLWTQLELLIDSGRLIIPKEVSKGIEVQKDELTIWFKKHKKCIVPYSENQFQIVREILKKYPKVSSYHKPRPNHADPFVVALAKEKKCIVVTWEITNGSRDNPAVPDLCKEHEIQSINPREFISHQSWKFGLSK